MKYYPIELRNEMNDKLIYTENQQGDFGIFDNRFQYHQKERRLKNIRFLVHGALEEADNFICEEQEIPLPEGTFQSIAFLGCTEYSTYTEKVIFRLQDGTEKKAPLTLYAISENIDSLYECELDHNTMIAFHAKGKYAQKMKYYISVIPVPEGSRFIVLPDNPEMHIAAITLIK